MNIESYHLQIGGHSQFIKPADPTKLCKPLVENELRFYEKIENLEAENSESNIFHSLRKFIPGYHGACEYQIKSELKFDQNISKRTQRLIGNSDIPKKLNKRKVELPFNKPTGSSKLSLRNENIQSVSSDEAYAPTESIKSNTNTKLNPTNTTSLSVRPEQDSSLEGYQVLKFIVLDDLLYDYKKPCIIDIKMGQRQRKPGATKDKEQRQLQKSITSTSNLLNFRLCGYLCYNKYKDLYYFRDKYWGRMLDQTKTSKAILRWFWNGNEYQFALMQLLNKKLKNLYHCLSKITNYRFWSSSLLCFFDGGLNNNDAILKSLDIRMIDFANLTFIPGSIEPDREYLKGLHNLIKILELLMRKLMKAKLVGQSNLCKTEHYSKQRSIYYKNYTFQISNPCNNLYYSQNKPKIKVCKTSYREGP